MAFRGYTAINNVTLKTEAHMEDQHTSVLWLMYH